MPFKSLDAIRRKAGPIEIDLIESYARSRISRRDFIKRGTIIGLSMPAMASVIAACGGSDETGSTTDETSSGATGEPVQGGNLIVANSSATPPAASTR